MGKFHSGQALDWSRLDFPARQAEMRKVLRDAMLTKLLGFPDATVVTPPFGVFVADNVQKIQFVFITNCRDEANTRHGLQRFFDWLTQTGEDVLLAQRAKARARIVRAVAKELKLAGSNVTGSGPPT